MLTQQVLVGRVVLTVAGRWQARDIHQLLPAAETFIDLLRAEEAQVALELSKLLKLTPM